MALSTGELRRPFIPRFDPRKPKRAFSQVWGHRRPPRFHENNPREGKQRNFGERSGEGEVAEGGVREKGGAVRVGTQPQETGSSGVLPGSAVEPEGTRPHQSVRTFLVSFCPKEPAKGRQVSMGRPRLSGLSLGAVQNLPGLAGWRCCVGRTPQKR